MVWLQEFINEFGTDAVIVNESLREKLSKDYYWYSPVLYEQLKNKIADCAIAPTSIHELQRIVSFAVKNKVPITPRGAGTGNYGQAIPLQGGIVIDLTKLDRIDMKGDRLVSVQAGVRLGVLEKTLRQNNRELRIFPSTYMKATVGGFLCGGSGGIGSIRWGNLWDDNVSSVTVMTVEETPRLLTISGDDMQQYIHNYGTTGLVVEAKLPVEPKVSWSQHIVFFHDFREAIKFSGELAHSEEIPKRLVSVCEWPIPAHFHPLKKVLREGQSIVMLEIEEKSVHLLGCLADKYDGDIGYTIPAENYQKGLKLSDFTWNHATLWAHKHGDNLTYLQARFQTDRIFEQMADLRSKFGDEIQFHFEYIKIQGAIVPASLPVVKYKSKERLYEIIQFCRAIEVEINDPHTYILGFGGYNMRMKELLKRKELNDPYNLLNPGKLPTAKEVQEFQL
ncbi:FAD-binding oxidoreductase [Priestia flexa]|uniref:FAD-binding oxidoreductase n=1 Tax=Priestia flexa TaxID=86664 RepID=UPI002890A2A3|nr:FAD-binding oxidoreductase [Priestia flexa]MDT2046974.1 FAD-binding oxidoreductase [Priestia flexa]